jgi:hypothetical protein
MGGAMKDPGNSTRTPAAIEFIARSWDGTCSALADHQREVEALRQLVRDMVAATVPGWAE